MVLITEEHTSCRRIKKGIVSLLLNRENFPWIGTRYSGLLDHLYPGFPGKNEALSYVTLTYLLLSLMKLEQKNSNVKSVIYFDFFQRWLLHQCRRSEQHFLVMIILSSMIVLRLAL